MSKILFWSPFHGQGQTCNLQVIAIIMSFLYRKRILLMQTHFSNNNLESPLVGYNVDNEMNQTEIFCGIGLDMAVTYSKMKKVNRMLLESCCLSFPNTSLLLLPGTQIQCKETFDRDIARSVTGLIGDTDEFVDFVMIDSNSGKDNLSLKLIDMADLVVINLTQRKYVINKLFEDYGELFIQNKKVFYLFGDYDENSSYNIKNCRMKYPMYIKENNSGIIPYCTKLLDAQNEGNILDFIKRGLRTDSRRSSNKLVNIIQGWNTVSRERKNETDYFFLMSCMSVEKIFSLL